MNLLLAGGPVWTGLGCPLDDTAPTAVAISGGLVSDVGNELELRARAGERTTVIDVGGRRIVPGLVDSHIHAVRAGLTYLDELDWTQADSVAECLQAVRRAADRLPAGTWITALGGWQPSQFAEDRLPGPEELDDAAPAHPAFVHPLYGHDDYGVLNSAALAALGWTGRCADPPGGVLHRHADGTPDGRLAGLTAFQQVSQLALRPSAARARASTTAFLARLAELGLTGVVDAGGLGMRPDKYKAIWAVWRAGELPIRVRMNVGASTRGSESGEVADWQAFLAPGMGDDMLSVLGLGEIMHLGCHDWVGLSQFSIGDAALADFTDMATQAAQQGWPMTVHAILDSSVTRLLDAIEKVSASVPIDGLRWSLCHAECISRANLVRVKSLGMGLAVQGRLGHKAGVCARSWGEAAVRNGPPLGDIVELGIPFGGGTDGTRDSSYNPWHALWWFVTGQSADGGPRRADRHLLDRASALDAYTRGSAWFSFEDDRRGTIKPGAYADLAVLSADYFAVPEAAIPSLTSDLTIVSGRIVHAAGPFAGMPVSLGARRPGP